MSIKRIKRKSIFLQGLFIVFFSGSKAWALPKPQKETHWTENIKIGAHVGLGLSGFQLYPRGLRKDTPFGTLTAAGRASATLGLILGYDFPYFQRLVRGEVGLNFSPFKYMKISIENQQNGNHMHIIVQERYLYIPMGIKIRFFRIGCEWAILLSSVYSPTGTLLGLIPRTSRKLKTSQNMEDIIADLQKIQSSFYMGGAFNLPRGFYIDIQIKIPRSIFEIFQMQEIKSIDQVIDGIDLARRIVNPSYLTLSLGVDMLKFFKRENAEPIVADQL